MDAFGVDLQLAEGMETDYLFRGPYEKSVFSRPFDLIYHNHVMEHMTDPCKFLNDINMLLVDKGIHVIKVPNEAQIFQKTHIGTFRHTHTTYYTPDQLCAILTLAGFTIIEKMASDSEILIVSQKTGSGQGPTKGLAPAASVPEYFARYRTLSRNLSDAFDSLKTFFLGKRVALYGACNLCYLVTDEEMIRESQVPVILDRAHAGMYLAGFNTRIEDDLNRLDAVDVVVVTAQNAQDDICRTVMSHAKRPAHMVTLFPNAEVHSRAGA
jgi:Methyltransferase domain